MPREVIIKKLRVREVDGGPQSVESTSFAKVSDDLDADSNGDRSVGVASCEDMFFRTETRNFIRRRTSQIIEKGCCPTLKL
jgi:hypothetical protein